MDEVTTWREGALGRIRLNRPRAINALTLDMIGAIEAALDGFEADDGVAAVAFDGAGERGLCAGADVRAVRAALLAGEPLARDFWRAEYALDARVAAFAKPVLAYQAGVTMGGGIGLTGWAAVRVADPDTRFAMPETGIGFFPDVAATWLLARSPGELGTHLAMTGATCTGHDGVLLGLADTASGADGWAHVTAEAAAGRIPDPARFPQPRIAAPLTAALRWVDECYVGDDPAAIRDRLAAHAHPHARAAADLMNSRSPLSVAVALAAVRRAATTATAAEVLASDLVVAERFMEVSDFAEGVRAVLVDRGDTPRWRHRDLSEVDPAEVAAYFPTD